MKGHLLSCKADAPFYGRDPRAKTTLVLYSIKDRKESTLAEGVDAWRSRATGARSSSRVEGALTLLDAKPDEEKKTVRRRAYGGSRSRGGVGRSSTRCGGATVTLLRRACTATTGRRSASATRPSCPTWRTVRPQLRPRRDGGGAEHRPRLHRGRRLRDPGAAEGSPSPGRASSSTRRPAGTASPASSPDRTRRSRTARRSPRWASTPGWATTCSRSTASSFWAATTRTGCCGTRPTPSP